MKKGALIFNAIVVVAIIVLFCLHFCPRNSACKQTTSTVAVPKGAFKIAYFDMDSVQTNYTYFKEVANELTDLEQKKHNELADRKNEYMKVMKQYQEKGSSMSQIEMAKAQKDLEQRDRDLQIFQQASASELQDVNFKKLHEVKKRIEEFLKDYNKNKGYNYIIINSSELVYYKDSTYDITSDVVKGLNELYKKK